MRKVPQPSDPSDNVADEAVHKELGDSLVRVATTASSLEAEQDSGNITKTQSKETPNESSSLGTTSGGGPRGNTLRSDEDRLKLNELMELYTTLQKKVLDLEKTKTTQANEIACGGPRFQETMGDTKLDEEITLVNVQDDADNETFDLNVLNDEEVFVAGQYENVVEEVVDVVQVSTAATTITITTEEITLARALKALKTSKPKNIEGYKLNDLKLKDFDSIQEISKRAGEELIQESLKKQKVDDKKETAELKQCMEIISDEEEVAIDAIPLASLQGLIFSQILKSFDKEDLEDLYKLVKARYGSIRPVESMDYLLWNDMKIMFEPHVEEEIYMLVEKRYPLTPPIITDLLNKKLQGRIVGIKSLLNAASIIAAHIRVNAA
ncbi:hypothetical protein Tco_0942578 [Tanacetum coccineum]